jgi:hypothetical protein
MHEIVLKLDKFLELFEIDAAVHSRAANMRERLQSGFAILGTLQAPMSVFMLIPASGGRNLTVVIQL